MSNDTSTCGSDRTGLLDRLSRVFKQTCYHCDRTRWFWKMMGDPKKHRTICKEACMAGGDDG